MEIQKALFLNIDYYNVVCKVNITTTMGQTLQSAWKIKM
jgi:hypothetical protein